MRRSVLRYCGIAKHTSYANAGAAPLTEQLLLLRRLLLLLLLRLLLAGPRGSDAGQGVTRE